MRLLLLMIFIIFFVKSGESQSKNIDSLKNAIDGKVLDKQIDSTLYKDYYTLAIHYYRKNPDSSLYYFSKGIETGKYIDNSEYISKCAFNSSLIYSKRGAYNAVDSLLEICLDANPTEFMLARCIKKKGDTKMRIADYEQAKSLLEEALGMGQAQQDTNFLSNIYNSIANLYEYTYEYDLAIEYHIRGRDIEKIKGDSIGYAISTCNMAILLNSMHEYENAFDYLLEAESYIHSDNHYNMYQIYEGKATYYQHKLNYDEAEKYLLRSLTCAEIIGAEDLQASSYQNLISISYKNDEIQKTKNYISEALKIPSLISFRRARIQLTKSYILIDEGKCKQALQLLESMEDQIKQDFDHYIKSSYYKNLARANACIGDYNGFDINLEQSFLSIDSGYNETRADQARIIEAKYNSKIKEDSINILQLQNQNQEYMISNQKSGLIAIIAALIAAVFILQYIFSRYKKAKQVNDTLVFEKRELLQLNNKLQEKLKNIPLINSKLESRKIELQGLNNVQLIEISDILYVASEDQGIRVHLHQRSFWSSTKLKDIEQELPESSFTKIYRSVIININHVEWLNHVTLKMINDDELKIGRTYKSNLQKILK